jgi:hypothetical protein
MKKLERFARYWRGRIRDLASLSVFLLAACSSSVVEPPPTPRIEGTFPLVMYQGIPLPFDVGPLIAPDGHDTGCRLRFTSGYLTLSSNAGTFTEAIDLRESCQNGLLSQDRVTGTFTQTETRLDFALTAPDQTLRYWGLIAPGKIDVYFNNLTFTYQRP